jgi:hypothetical protein
VGSLAPRLLPTVDTDPAPRSEEPQGPVLQALCAGPGLSGHRGLDSTFAPKKETGSR